MPAKFGFVLTYHDGARLVAMTDLAFTQAQRDAVCYLIANAGKVPVAPAEDVAAARIIDAPKIQVPAVGGFTRQQARDSGYVGDPCTNCQGIRTRRNGSCLVCEDCGQTTGCS